MTSYLQGGRLSRKARIQTILPVMRTGRYNASGSSESLLVTMCYKRFSFGGTLDFQHAWERIVSHTCLCLRLPDAVC